MSLSWRPSVTVVEAECHCRGSRVSLSWRPSVTVVEAECHCREGRVSLSWKPSATVVEAECHMSCAPEVGEEGCHTHSHRKCPALH